MVNHCWQADQIKGPVVEDQCKAALNGNRHSLKRMPVAVKIVIKIIQLLLKMLKRLIYKPVITCASCCVIIFNHKTESWLLSG